jgi:peptide subunit release factor 1 (eRF1)
MLVLPLPSWRQTQEAIVATTVLNPTFKDAQWLSDHAAGEGMVVSCYSDISPAGVRPLWHEHLKNEVKRIDETLSGNAAATHAFHQNIAAIEAVLSSRRPAAARGMAIFAASERNLLQVYALASVVPNRLVVDEEPYLVPLLELLHRQRRYLVVHTDTHRGRLYTAVPGAVHMIEEIDEPVPKRHRAAGELWGKQQATIARHREDHVIHYLKRLARETERAWPEERYDGIVLLGEHEVLAKFRTYLTEELRSSIAGELPHAWTGRQVPLLEKIDSIHARALREQERQLFEDIKRRLMEDHHIVTGPQAVIDAIENDQIGYSGCVVMESDPGEIASRCSGCHKLFAQAIDECPSCHASCEKTNLWQAIALFAARKHVVVHFIEPGHGLDKHAGVVALLAREAAWIAHPERVLAASLPERRA